MDTKSPQNKLGLMSAYKNTLGGNNSSPNLKYNTVDTSKTSTNNSPSTAEDSPRTRIRLTQTSKNIASMAKETKDDPSEKKKSKDDSFIKENSTGIVKNNTSETKQMSRATISVSKKNHMDLMTNIKNMRAQLSPTMQKDTPSTQEQDNPNEDESFLRRGGRGPATGGGRVARIFSTDELKHLKRAWTTSIAPPKDPSNIPSSNPASVHYSRAEPSPSPSVSLGSSRGTKTGTISRGTIDTSRNGTNLSVDSIVTNTNDKITLMIISSSSFASGLATSRIERLGSKVYFLLDVSKNGVKSGMLLRSYKHFQRFHQKVEMTFPSLFEEIRLPKKGINIMGGSEMKDTLIKDLQEYLNKITSITEVLKSSPFISFLDPTEAPLLVYLTNPEKEGYLRVSRGLMQSLAWTEVWVVVKHKRLYIFLDNNASSLPITNIKLQYCSISFKTTKDVNQDTFEIKAWNRNKDYNFKVKDEQERNEWVTFLRNSKAKAIAEAESSFDNSDSFKNTLITHIPVSDVLVQYASMGGMPSSIDHRSIELYNSIKNEANQLNYEEDGPSNIVFHGKKNTIKGATVEKLLEKLTEEEQDMDFVFAFLLTYRSFATPSVLLHRCIQRFCSPPMKRNMTISAIHPTQLRVCTVLTKWVEVNFHEFVEDISLASVLIIFIETDLVSQARFQVMGKKLKDLIRKKVNNERLTVNAELKLLPPELPPLFAANSFDVFDISPVEMARQSTLLEFSLFKAIEPKECLGQKWNKKDQKDQALHIMAVIKRFNQVSNWVVTKIVLTDDLKARVALLSRFIEIANACMQINNYNTAMEIIAGLNSSSVFRLKLTWEALSPSMQSTFNKIKEQLSHDGSYRNLRELLHSRQPPTIPYFGIYLTDLVFADEANPDKISDHGLFNFEKNYLLYKIIKEIQLYQQTPYNFQAVPEIQDYLISAKFLDENETYELSLKCEPRDAS